MLNFLLNDSMIILILVQLFILGAIVGSFLNVWIARLSYQKSVIWPLGSRCGHCLQSIRWYDNIPLLSYWALRGRCRTCGQTFSIRYFFVELIVAAGFPLIFYLEIVQNIHGIPALQGAAFNLQSNLFGAHNLPYLFFFLQHAILFCFLVAAAGCDLESRQIPLPLTLIGTVIGIIFAVAMPWPWPTMTKSSDGNYQAMPYRTELVAHFGSKVERRKLPPQDTEWWTLTPRTKATNRPNEQLDEKNLDFGIYPWPVWGPLPSWLPPGSWRLGLATGLVGALVGTFLLRSVKFLFERGFGREALGLGDADLMMMVGAFLGWQVVVISFLAGGLASLVIALPKIAMGGDSEIPFGPGLAVGTFITWLAWSLIGPNLQVLLFNPSILGVFILGCGAVLLLMSFLFGLFRRKPAPSAAES